METTAKKLLIKAISIWQKTHESLLEVEGEKIDRNNFIAPSTVYINEKIIMKHGIYQCPLCIEYHRDNDCSGCPIKEHTGYNHCDNTPYRTLTYYMIKTKPKTVTKKLIRIHQEMIDLMKKILKDTLWKLYI